MSVYPVAIETEEPAELKEIVGPTKPASIREPEQSKGL